MLIRIISVSIHFLSLIKNHGFLKLLGRSVDMIKCCEPSFKGKAKVEDMYCVSFEDL